MKEKFDCQAILNAYNILYLFDLLNISTFTEHNIIILFVYRLKHPKVSYLFIS